MPYIIRIISVLWLYSGIVICGYICMVLWYYSMIYVWCVVCMYNVWLYDIICIWVWLYIWLYGCMSTWIYVIWCVVLCEIVSVVILALCVMWCYDFSMIYTCVIWSCVMSVDFAHSAKLEFLHVVLNTTCDCIWCYVMWFGIYKVWLL